jgi:hypothetical protein
MTWSPTRHWPGSGAPSGGSRRPAAKTSARRAPQHASRVPFALLVTSLIAGGLGLLLLLNTASAANEVRRHDISARDASIAARLQQLQIEVAASAAPGNLALAAAALGMVPAVNPAFLVVGTDGSVRVMGSPAQVSVAAVPKRAHPKKTAKSSSTSAASSKSATSSATSTAHSTATHTSSQPAPSPTPTPTLTLPGGNR